MTPARRAMLDRVAAAVLALPAERTVRVGIDGVDGAGKTTFADELSDRLASSGRPLIRAGVDWFHHPKRVRYHRGRYSPEGHYRDSYDYAALRRLLLDPLGPGGTSECAPGVRSSTAPDSGAAIVRGRSDSTLLVVAEAIAAPYSLGVSR